MTITLNREVDVSRGDVIVDADSPADVSDQFEIELVWMEKEVDIVDVLSIENRHDLGKGRNHQD